MIRNHSLSLTRGLAGAALVAAALATGCSPSTATPAADPSTAVAGFGGNDLPPGTKVQVARQGQWYPATIVQPLGEGRFMIHYDNTGNEWNEPVGLDRIKTLGAGPTAGPARDYRPGEKVLVTVQNRVLLADVVMQASADIWRVHYDGYGPEAAENVGPARLRRPFTGASGHAVGESVSVDVNGQVLPAKILAVSAADKWVVRFESFGPQYDQEVGVDRIRAAAGALVAPPPVAPPPPAPPEPPPPVKPEKPAKPEKPGPPPPKPPPVAEVGPLPQSGPPSVGETVLVNVHHAWFPVHVVSVGPGGYKVKFHTGAEAEVQADKVTREPATTRGLRYQNNQLVLVEWKGLYAAGKILKPEGKGEYRVRFDGLGPENDEVVTVKRLKPR
jgi:hypothetical protein